jgi:aryl-alcohol dehydrogenase-like predicted oxidoreductase
MMQSEWRRESPVIAREIAVHARERSMSPAHFAFAWLLNNRFVTAAIGGRCTEEQWGEYCGALECRLTAEDEALVDRLVSPGHPSTPGYNDRQYPIEGRVLRSG